MTTDKNDNNDNMDAFERASYVSLKTYRKNGTSVAVPLWHVIINGSLFMFTEGRSYKVGRIKRNPAAQIAVCRSRGDVVGPWIDATARIMGSEKDDPQLVERLYKEMRQKYGWQIKLIDFGSWLSGRINFRAEIEVRPQWPV